MKRITLTKAKTGQKAKIVEITSGISARQRLMSTGIYPGREITRVGHSVLEI